MSRYQVLQTNQVLSRRSEVCKLIRCDGYSMIQLDYMPCDFNEVHVYEEDDSEYKIDCDGVWVRVFDVPEYHDEYLVAEYYYVTNTTLLEDEVTALRERVKWLEKKLGRDTSCTDGHCDYCAWRDPENDVDDKGYTDTRCLYHHRDVNFEDSCSHFICDCHLKEV